MTPAGDRHRGCELYVYYRVPAADADAAAQEVRSAQQRLAARWPALQARLLRQASEPGGPVTWMEVYQHPDGLDDTLLAQLGAALADLPTTRIGTRHEERFVPQG